MPLTNGKQAFDEFKAGDLHSGKGGPIVKNRKQAIAIALSVQRRHGGGPIPKTAKSPRRGR